MLGLFLRGVSALPEAVALPLLRRLNRRGGARDIARVWSGGHVAVLWLPAPGRASPAGLLHLYALAGRRRVLLPRVRSRLLAAMKDETHRLAPEDLFLWFCVLFSEKRWPAIARLAGRAREITDPEARAAIGDLLYSTWHRMHFFGRPKLARKARRGLREIGALPEEQRELHRLLDRHVAGEVAAVRPQLARDWTYGPSFALSPVAALLAPGEGGPRTSLPRLGEVPHKLSACDEIVSVSCDRAYAERFLPAYLAELRRVSPGTGLHVHCAGFDPRGAALGELEADDVGWSQVTLPADLAAARPERRRAWYAGLRLILLEDLLAAHDIVHVSDLDGLPVRPPREAWSDAAHPVHLRTRLEVAAPRRLPWQSVSAAHLTVRSGAEGARFAATVRDYLARCFGRPLGQTWYADQLALYHAYVALRDEIAIGTGPGGFFGQGGNWSFAGGDAGKDAFIARHLGQQNGREA